MITSKHFNESEFKNCIAPCSLQDMDQGFMNTLDKIRELSGIPLVINCAYRSVEHEKKQGRTGTSSHTLGRAVDIRCSSSRNRYLIINAALKTGITRIGISFKGNFIHLDDSEIHDKQVIWDY